MKFLIIKVSLGYGYTKGYFSRLLAGKNSFLKSNFDINMIPDYKRTFAILDGADANKFTLAGNKLTFIATAFEARSDAFLCKCLER
jgi:hypothetical protein